MDFFVSQRDSALCMGCNPFVDLVDSFPQGLLCDLLVLLLPLFEQLLPCFFDLATFWSDFPTEFYFHHNTSLGRSSGCLKNSLQVKPDSDTLADMPIERAKKAAAEQAASLIESGQIVGLGSGSTAHYFIESLGKRVKEGLAIETVASSTASANLAQQWGIPLKDIDQIPWIDLTVDGADEIDPLNRMIKGGGGAHVREKVLAAFSHQVVILVDETKLVDSVGTKKLPLEILKFGAEATRKKIEALSYQGDFRKDSNGRRLVTDNGNYLYDIAFSSPPKNPEEEEKKLSSLPGVIDTGFFFGYASFMLIGYKSGLVERRTLPLHPSAPHRRNL